MSFSTQKLRTGSTVRGDNINHELLQRAVEFGQKLVYYQDQRGGCIEGMLMAAIMLLCTILVLRWIIGLVPPGFW